MARWRPDPTFYPSPRDAMQAPAERLAYVATLAPDDGQHDAIAVVDLDPASPGYGGVVNTLELPYAGDELHHFGWNACSSALCPSAGHPHVERRYLVVPGLRSSRIYIVDTQPDPRAPTIARVIEPEEVKGRGGYSRPHTVQCGPDAIYVSAMGTAEGEEGPGGVFLLDHHTFDVIGPWEKERGDQYLAYDFWWHINEDVMVTSEWAVPRQFERGIVPEELLAGRYGHRIHFWDMRKRRLQQTVDLGAEHQMALELRPAHDPAKHYGFVGSVVSLKDLSASIWVWHREGREWRATKVIEIPAEPAEADRLPGLLQGFGAVPPLVTDLDLSLDDRFLYVSCWGTGEMRQYDVSDPFAPKLTGSVRIGGIAHRQPHPRGGQFAGGPQMVEISRDGRRVYFTNSLYSAWDDQFYGGRFDGVMVKLNADPGGGLEVDGDFLVEFGERRAHQVRLEGGDASTDSFCFS